MEQSFKTNIFQNVKNTTVMGTFNVESVLNDIKTGDKIILSDNN